jgi:hypothetical protein
MILSPWFSDPADKMQGRGAVRHRLKKQGKSSGCQEKSKQQLGEALLFTE